MREYDTYIFDLDGTLLDTLTDLAASCNYALRTAGMPERTLDEVRLFVGNGVKLLMERATPGGLGRGLKKCMRPSVATTLCTVSIRRALILALSSCWPN